MTTEELKLGLLADNGGPTETYALLPGSVAIDRIPPAMCVDADGQPLTEDERGVARPQGVACDMGAFEFSACTADSDCDDSNDCTSDQCDVDPGSCAYTNEVNGTSCDPSGVAGTCESGVCKSWQTPALIGPELAGAYTTVAVDPDGNVTAVWSQSDGVRYNIYANRYTPGGGWGIAELIETSNEAAARYYSPEMAIDPDGNVTAVWCQSDGVRYNIYANRYTPSEGWGTAELLGASDTESAYPKVGIDPDGNVTAVWSQYLAIYANRYTPSEGWGTAERIDSYDPPLGTGSGNILPDVAVDLDGNAIAVWVGRVSSGGLSRRDDIWANRYTPGGGWGVPELIETNDGMYDTLGYPDSRVSVAVDLDGNATAVWNQSEYDTGTSIWANRYTPGGGWGVPELIENRFYVWRPAVVVNPSGNAIAVWQTGYFSSSPTSIWSNRYTPSGGWGLAEQIETQDPGGPGGGTQPDVVVDLDGNATAAWQWYSSATGDSSIRAARFYPDDGWQAAVPIQLGEGHYPRLTVDRRGDVTAVWSESSSVWSNRFE